MASIPTTDESSAPLVLLNGYYASPQSTVSISFAFPITIGRITIWSATPFLITTTSSIKLTSTAPLGSDFARGWNKLSDNLKARVLSNILTVERALDVDDFHGVSATCPEAIQAYFTCLRSTPEIAAFLKEIFYGHNTFMICPTSKSSISGIRKNWTAAYPNPSMGPLITRLALQVDLSSKRWKFLRAFRHFVKYDYTNIKYVKVVFVKTFEQGATNPATLEAIVPSLGLRPNVKFKCRGELILASDKYGVQGFTETQAAQLKSILDSLVTFRVAEEAEIS